MSKKFHVILLGVWLLLALRASCQTYTDSARVTNMVIDAGFNSYPTDVKNIDKIRASISWAIPVECTQVARTNPLDYTLSNANPR